MSGQWPRARHERGASAVEHALLVAGIAAVLVIGIVVLGARVGWLFDETCDNVGEESSSSQC